MSNLCVKGGVSSNSEVEMTLAGGDHLLFPENERNSSGHDDTETVSERVVSESNHSEEFPNNTRARGERGDKEEKDWAGVEAATNVETRINGQGDIVEEREDKEINDESSSNLEGSCSAEEEGGGDVEEQEDSVSVMKRKRGSYLRAALPRPKEPPCLPEPGQARVMRGLV